MFEKFLSLRNPKQEHQTKNIASLCSEYQSIYTSHYAFNQYHDKVAVEL